MHVHILSAVAYVAMVNIHVHNVSASVPACVAGVLSAWAHGLH